MLKDNCITMLHISGETSIKGEMSKI